MFQDSHARLMNGFMAGKLHLLFNDIERSPNRNLAGAQSFEAALMDWIWRGINMRTNLGNSEVHSC